LLAASSVIPLMTQFFVRVQVLETRVLSTAAGPKMQLLQGTPDITGVSELPIDVRDRHEQLDMRFHKLADAVSKCRVEVNITLRLLRAIKVAENSLTQITFNLHDVKEKMHTLPFDNREEFDLVRTELEAELVRGQAAADAHIPTLEQLAVEHPKGKLNTSLTLFTFHSQFLILMWVDDYLLYTHVLNNFSRLCLCGLAVEAKERIWPVLTSLRNTVEELRRVTEEVRIRSEQTIKLAPTPAIPVSDGTTTQEFIAPSAPSRKHEPPVIVKPLQNVYADEGKSVVMEVQFQSNLPAGNLNYP
jgi:hypothetical protein